MLLSPVIRALVALRARASSRVSAVTAQRRTLDRLLRIAAGTRFGRAHDFARLRGPDDFAAAVPLRRYEDFWRDWFAPAWPTLDDLAWPGRIPFFALSSGTTSGTAKRVPVTRAMLASNRRAGLDALAFHFAARPASNAVSGRSLMLGGSTALEAPAPGVRAGDLSGIATATLPWYAAPLVFPPRALALLADWEAKLELIAKAAIDQRITTLTGTPSWLLLLLERLRAERATLGRVSAPLPDLALLLHGGVRFDPYRRRFAELLEPATPDLREVYPASEGFFATADRGFGEGLRLNVDHGLYFEFVPVGDLDSPRPTRHRIGTVEIAVNYALVVSSCAGLWSYIVGDTVRFITLDPPRLLITGRTSYMLSDFGEHLIGEEIDAALSAAAAAAAIDVVDYSVAAAHFAADGTCHEFTGVRRPEGWPDAPGGHVYVVEANRLVDPTTAATLAHVLDRELCARNDDYRAHRAPGVGIAPPQIVAAPPGCFTAWMKARGRLGGQNKVPRVIHDTGLMRTLLDAARNGAEAPP
ncbi:MAG: GH3 auxin-responsive promoter family protein [Alphaproteobacteria bacterium]|nr:GH3 auxin-responsive promoter family protein [Alphaproteobacteria bacterium]MCW5742323.1 GH3 auxin-responsive promoter family protein [Alphaproteobacteria bacterium]